LRASLGVARAREQSAGAASDRFVRLSRRVPPGLSRSDRAARLGADLRQGLLNIFADRVLPAQQYVPARSDASFEEAAATLNASPIGVIFNSYDPNSGMGFLYGNDAARRALPTEKEDSQHARAARRRLPGRRDLRYASHVSAERDIHPITADAIKSALWLSLVWLYENPGGQMDGAYHRSCIISELHDFDRVFVARPLAMAGMRQGARQLVRGAGLQCEIVVLGRLQGPSRCP